ncbi:MAG: FAD-binding protein [Gammaproteobacteria bacterium]|nr:FAD-binding protein [Gammaproteobacteria bacterium]
MQLPDDFILKLKTAAGDDNILSETSDCWPYGGDNSKQHALPDRVVFATHTNQIQSVIKLCNQYKIPIVARGRGTGTTGATVPTHGGLVLSLERMNKIIEVNANNRYIIAQPGATNLEIQQAAGEHGFFWPPDPTSAEFCTLGGNLAYNSAGPKAVKYGTPRENTLGLTAITGNGDIINTGVHTTKGVVGYDFTRLLIGSEGTLGIITEAILKLTPLPEGIATLQALYTDIQHAADAVASIMSQAVIPSSLEFIDKTSIEMIRGYSDIDLPSAGAMLMIEVDGNKATLSSSINAIEIAANNTGLISIKTASTEQERKSLWRIRKALSPALRTIAPKKINEDVVVPVSNIPALLNGLEGLSEKYSIPIVNFGHAGNGNIHVNLLIDPDNKQQAENADNCLSQVFDLVLSLNGTLSGEHGVGLVKREFIKREIDPVTLDLMRKIKSQFDPENILNPGKMFPDA